MRTEGQRGEKRQCQSKELLGIQKDAFLRDHQGSLIYLQATNHSRVNKQRIQGDRVGKTQVGRGMLYLVIVKVEHVSPPGPRCGIGEVRVTSCA